METTHPQGITLQLQGHLNTAHTEKLRQQITDAISSQRSSQVLVDMSQVESLDSSVFLVLVSMLILAKSLDCQFGLSSISPSVRIILDLTGLDNVFPILST